jgi:hypothetical protein
VTWLQFFAAIVNSLAWPVAVVALAVLLRRELIGMFQRMQSLEIAGGKATFATLPGYEQMIAVAAQDVGGPDGGAILAQDMTEFSVVAALAAVAPGQAVIDAWGLLEYQLNVASDRVAPDQPHGWPQVDRNLEVWDKWPLLRAAVLELRRLRDYTVQAKRPPSPADAARYVSVAQDLTTTIRAAFMSAPNAGADEHAGGGS